MSAQAQAQELRLREKRLGRGRGKSEGSSCCLKTASSRKREAGALLLLQRRLARGTRGRATLPPRGGVTSDVGNRGQISSSRNRETTIQKC